MYQETFVTHSNLRWFWLITLSVCALVIVYILSDPIEPKNGGTVLGYTYGGLAAAGMLILMWYGIRKRSYRAANTTLKGSLAFHVWLGVALLIIVPLHSGFRFHWNVHTLSYVLVCLTIVSGIWGAINYVVLPKRIRSHRGGASTTQLIEQVEQISDEISEHCRTKSPAFLEAVRMLDFEPAYSIRSALRNSSAKEIDAVRSAEFISALPSEEEAGARQLVGLIYRKQELYRELCDGVRVHFWMRVWLYLHLPLSIAAIVAVIVHVVVVLAYA